ncbi:TetR/AcrR family transcriptional regulator [Amycolatopsis orientalis]|uniref:TetR/AcrR family transcriptional regulator n=1 Tax=Amycolatopsis orientalis TaxID=31958 RepID=UPI00190FB143|nr:TetR/AcrR family transcriptional regulator [Amycolatopsis orientalis]
MSDFQRARSPEQVEARREEILDVAEQLLTESSVGEISMRELARRVGLSASNVARYFPTREAVYLEVLDRARGAWLDSLALDGDLPEVAATLASSLAARPVLCELISVLANVLERNVSTEIAREYKLRSAKHNARTADLLRTALPDLTPETAQELSAAIFVFTAGMWPLAHPNEAVQEAIKDPRLSGSRIDFEDRLTRLIVVLTLGYQAASPRTGR